MESWCFDSLDKGYVSSETIPPSDSIIRTKNVLMGLEFKPPFCYDGSILVPNQQSMQNPGFPLAGFVGETVSPSTVTSNVIPGDDESNSIVELNCGESSLVDLKLGGFGDNPTSKSSTPLVWSEESPTPKKRARLTSLSSQAAYCQVYGCNKDLSSAKEYHKRHRVCDVHSKTAKVIVNGIQQRFCQQCSRFHILAEFDDGKRSCRKRLAGHNERRRKPQVGFRAGRSHYSHTGDILPRGPPRAEIYETNMWGRHIKVEDGLNYVHRLDNTCTSELLHQYRPLVGNINTFGIGNAFSENMSQYPSEIVSRSLNEDSKLFNFNVASTIEGCALSLLSSQSQNSSGCSSLIRPSSGGPHYSVSEISEKLFGVQDRCSEFTNNKDHFSCEDGNTTTLLQLSSQLQRVENQRQSAPIRQETEGSWCLRII